MPFGEAFCSLVDEFGILRLVNTNPAIGRKPSRG